MPVRSGQVDVTHDAVRVVTSVPPSPGGGGPPRGRFTPQGPQRFIQVKNLGPVTAFLGGAQVSEHQGVPILPNGILSFWLVPMDEIWACTSVDIATVSYIETGGDADIAFA